MSSLLAGLVPASVLMAQPGGTLRRAAVVIGVNKCGGLPVLNAAVTGAESMAAWLGGEGFEVKLFVDKQRPVIGAEVGAGIKELVEHRELDQLVVYFSGHGFLTGFNEIWMLSGAPGDANEAVSLSECIELSRETPIANVVFISDACRSTADSLRSSRVRGQVVFPNDTNVSKVHTKVDRFLAARPGKASYEAAVEQSSRIYEGYFTEAFLEAFRRPDQEMVRTVGGLEVVPSRRLEAYLRREVPKRAQARLVTLQQEPQVEVVSGDDVYIGRASGAGYRGQSSEPPAPTIADVANVQLTRFGTDLRDNLFGSGGPAAIERLTALAATSGYIASQQSILRAPGPPQFETQTGVAVYGARLMRAAMKGSSQPELLTSGDGVANPALVRCRASWAPGSIALQFAEGTGTVLALLDGYIATVVVDEGGVSSVSYVPSQNSMLWDEYRYEKERVEALRATVATAARYGVFRIEGDERDRPRRASNLANTIRVLKRIDPSLGLYAAYAYAEADLLEDVKSVERYMLEDLRTNLFDVAMLSGMLNDRQWARLSMTSADREMVVPFCPMLTQGWGRLRTRNVRLHPAIDQARDHLRNALWTTFTAEGMRLIFDALLREGG